MSRARPHTSVRVRAVLASACTLLAAAGAIAGPAPESGSVEHTGPIVSIVLGASAVAYAAAAGAAFALLAAIGAGTPGAFDRARGAYRVARWGPWLILAAAVVAVGVATAGFGDGGLAGIAVYTGALALLTDLLLLRRHGRALLAWKP